MELYKLTAKELSKMLKRKECSCVELTKSIFSRIDAIESKIGAYLCVARDMALNTAMKVDRKLFNKEDLSDIAGIPIGIKDNICTKGMSTTCASKMLSNYFSPYDATVVKRLKDSDAVITGKLNLDEFAMGSTCENSYYKITKNPHNILHVPGGSSGGSAAAVSACEAIASLGTDTGGSVRLPASHCGIVGLKPTYGSVSRFGMVAFASSLDQIGPMGRCVADVAMVYDTICGHDPMDATSVKLNKKSFYKDISPQCGKLKIFIPSEFFSDNNIDEEIKESVLNSAYLFEKNGAYITSGKLPFTDYACDVYKIISSSEASSNLARFDGIRYGHQAKEYNGIQELYTKSRTEGFGEEVKLRILFGAFALSSENYEKFYLTAKKLQKKIISDIDNLFNEYDIILTPTSTSSAEKIGESVDIDTAFNKDICTVFANISGVPAITLPCGIGKNNIPIGLQLIGNRFSEQQLFNLSSFYESTVGDFKSFLPHI